MLVIRQAQFTALEESTRQGFLRRMVQHLRGHFPDSFPEVRERQSEVVVAWIDDARRFGLVQEEHVQAYLELCAEFLELQRRPVPLWVVEIMTFPDRPPERKLELLEDELFFAPPETVAGPNQRQAKTS